MRAKKSYGQHFLKEESISKRIASSLEHLDEYQHIVEVGPGMGMLTKYLLEIPDHQLTAIEADEDMVDFLDKNYPKLKGHIVSEDFLKVDLQGLLQGQSFAIIGNFPYNISSQILFKALENKDTVPELVGMFQKEVAERIAAGPGNKDYGILSVLIQAFFDVKYLFSVKPGSFNPPPKIQSGVISLYRKKDYKNLGCDETIFKMVIKVSFNTRRKMLRNTMKPFLPKEVIDTDPFYEKRPEQLSVAEFVFLANEVEKHRKK